MKLVKANGGQSIAVYNPEKGSDVVQELLKDDRVNYAVPADYSEDSDMETVVKAIIKKIVAVEEMKSYKK